VGATYAVSDPVVEFMCVTHNITVPPTTFTTFLVGAFVKETGQILSVSLHDSCEGIHLTLPFSRPM